MKQTAFFADAALFSIVYSHAAFQNVHELVHGGMNVSLDFLERVEIRHGNASQLGVHLKRANKLSFGSSMRSAHHTDVAKVPDPTLRRTVDSWKSIIFFGMAATGRQ